ncbi:methionine--tRNA ligase [Flavobacteriaceae bacterium]|nr:methionine--tRNA ligase [Flavobacteriaceae bacterium]MDB4093825.1 methionine--tRNA ligase [Flavobacteriaceae bacterium]MDB9853368.1 methionine--tRNA ligase [Flavobacteriaceae bacterium]MDB9995192.1 methionine--tRNA ligase [Flavobacteriaceae bacterium]
MNKKRFTITAALPYANGPIHIGHLAGAYVPADIYSRYLKLNGHDVVFICGSDEHGAAIPIRAKKEGVSPQEIIDKYHFMIKDSFLEFGISFDNYSRTSSKIHHETASEFFKELNQKNIFIEKESEQLYDAKENQFLADRFVEGECPKCGYKEAYGDQCESCGSSLNATDLINPISKLSGNKPVFKKTTHWFLPLNKFDSFLKKWFLIDNEKTWKTNVFGQVKSWINEGLKPRAITRDLDWGIPVPIKGAENKVLYVWFDAPIGYISATKEWAKSKNIDWEPYWKDSKTELVHFIGKDNIVFHCIIFPSILKASGKFILPKNVPANEFLNLEGKKISTSKNWAIWLHEYLIDFPNMQDTLRYTLTSNAPENKDNDFTWKDFQAKNNNELVAIFGNFINRVVVLTHKYYEGNCPKLSSLNKIDEKVLNEIYNYPKKIGDLIESYKFREAVNTLIDLARLGNKYLADEEPWKIIKTENSERVKTIMNIALQLSGVLSIVSEPFLPNTALKLRNMLNLQSSDWNSISKENPIILSKINKGELLFRKIEDDEIDLQLQKLNESK